MKKIILILLLIATTATVGFFYFTKFNLTPKVQISPFDAIPNSIPIFGYADNLNQLSSDIDSLNYAESVKNATWYKVVFQQTEYANILLNKLDSSGNSFKIATPLFGLTQIGSGNLGVLFVSEIKEETKIDVKKLFSIFKKLNVKISKYDYNNWEIFTINGFENKENFSFTIYENLFIGSFETPLVEQSIDAIKSESTITKSEELLNIKNESKLKSDLHFYVHISNIGSLSQIVSNKNYSEAFSSLKDLGEWMYISINFLENEVALNGYSTFKNEGKSTLKKLSSSSPTDFTIDEVLPNSTAFFNATLSDNNSIFDTEDLEKSYYYSWIDQQYSFFILESFDDKVMSRAGLVAKATSTDDALLNIAELNKGFSIVDTIQSNFIYSLGNQDLFNSTFKNALFPFEKIYYTAIKDYIFFAENIGTLKSCIQKNNEGSVLSKEIDYRDFIEKASSKTNYYIYTNNEKLKPITKSIFKEDFLNPNAISKVVFQLSNINNRFFTTGTLLYSKNRTEKTSKKWEVKLKANGIFKPATVINHNNNSTEIFTQDEENRIYLINSSGEILFETQIEERIISDIFQVDYYSNGKLQYVFNTITKVYVLDRLGRNVGDFPRKLPAKATTGMLVVNYDKKGKYRYFIPCENNSIYGYKVDFLPLEGWKPLRNTGKILQPMQHHSINGKDFLTYIKDDSIFVALNRKGEERFNQISLPGKAAQNFEYSKNTFHNGIDGKYISISEKGQITTQNLLDSTYQQFCLGKSVLQNYTAYGFANENQFIFLKNEIQKLASFQIEEKIENIKPLYFNDLLWFLITTDGYKTYFIDEIGTLHSDFPLELSSPIKFLKINNNENDFYITQTDDSKISLFQIKAAN